MSAQCECLPGYTGDDCSLCAGGARQPCVRGQCDADGSCSNCMYGYFGPLCDQECPNGALQPCGGITHGNCTINGTCVCNGTAGWTGRTCTERCPGWPDNVCNHHGSCITSSSVNVTCVCEEAAYRSVNDGMCQLCPDNTRTLSTGPKDGPSACVECPKGQWGSNPNTCEVCDTQGCDGGIRCSLGYQDRNCKSCLPGFYFEFSSVAGGSTCNECQSASAVVVVVVLLLLAVSTLLLLWLNSSDLIQELLVPVKLGYGHIQGNKVRFAMSGSCLILTSHLLRFAFQSCHCGVWSV